MKIRRLSAIALSMVLLVACSLPSSQGEKLNANEVKEKAAIESLFEATFDPGAENVDITYCTDDPMLGSDVSGRARIKAIYALVTYRNFRNGEAVFSGSLIYKFNVNENSSGTAFDIGSYEVRTEESKSLTVEIGGWKYSMNVTVTETSASGTISISSGNSEFTAAGIVLFEPDESDMDTEVDGEPADPAPEAPVTPPSGPGTVTPGKPETVSPETSDMLSDGISMILPLQIAEMFTIADIGESESYPAEIDITGDDGTVVGKAKVLDAENRTIESFTLDRSGTKSLNGGNTTVSWTGTFGFTAKDGMITLRMDDFQWSSSGLEIQSEEFSSCVMNGEISFSASSGDADDPRSRFPEKSDLLFGNRSYGTEEYAAMINLMEIPEDVLDIITAGKPENGAYFSEELPYEPYRSVTISGTYDESGAGVIKITDGCCSGFGGPCYFTLALEENESGGMRTAAYCFGVSPDSLTAVDVDLLSAKWQRK